MISLKKILFVLFVLLNINQTFAQEFPLDPLDPKALRTTTSSNGIYVLTNVDDLSSISMAIKVVGNVPRSGMYIVRKGMRLDDILGLAGGPSITQRRKQDKNTITVLLSRKTDSGRVVIYNELWDNMMSSNEEFPTMQDGDIVEVKTVTETGFGRTELVQIGVQAGFTVVGILVQILFYSLNKN